VKWHKFWDSIWNLRGNSKNTKLRGLVKECENKGPVGKEYGLGRDNEIAKGMYTTPSTNTHKYSGGAVDLSELPLDQEVHDILDFLMPEAGLNVNLDWDAERKDWVTLQKRTTRRSRRCKRRSWMKRSSRRSEKRGRKRRRRRRKGEKNMRRCQSGRSRALAPTAKVNSARSPRLQVSEKILGMIQWMIFNDLDLYSEF
jgi:hypothetical protein